MSGAGPVHREARRLAALGARAAAAARIGVWECRLADETLTWTDAVYDLFDVPRGAPLCRPRILDLYRPDSLAALERVRGAAIARGNDFTLEAEIVTASGRNRWIRLNGSVDRSAGVPVRLFGLKRDVTEEKRERDRLQERAERDALTGLSNRARFDLCLAGRTDIAVAALLLVDLDGFKPINDVHGHAAGDLCLVEVADRLRRVCGPRGLVARVGGDEFALLLASGLDGGAPERIAAEIVAALAEPVCRHGLVLSIGASVGIARQAGCGPALLYARADAALYAAKAAGRGTFRSFERMVDPTGGGRAPRRVPPAALLGLR